MKLLTTAKSAPRPGLLTCSLLARIRDIGLGLDLGATARGQELGPELGLGGKS